MTDDGLMEERMMDYYPVSSPGVFGPGELKMHTRIISLVKFLLIRKMK